MDNTRKPAIDYLRIFASWAVLTYHVLGSSYKNDLMLTQQVRSVISGICAALQWHVPVYLMITGYLWLDKYKECTYKKIWTHIRKFLLVLLTVGYLYALMERVFNSGGITLEVLLWSLVDVLHGNSWEHMWYLYTIIGVYLLLPVMKPFYLQTSNAEKIIFIAILFLFTVLSSIVETMTGYSLPIDLPLSLPMFYVCAGGLISSIKLNEKVMLGATIVFACSTIMAIVLGQFVYYEDAIFAIYECIASISLFIAVFKFFPNTTARKWVRKVSDCTFGIYLIHPLFINIMMKVFHVFPLRSGHPLLTGTVAIIVVSTASFSVIYLLRKIAFIKRTIL